MKNQVFNMHHKVKVQLDAICQEAGHMNVTEFMQVYESLKPITIGSIDLNRGKIPLTSMKDQLQKLLPNHPEPLTDAQQAEEQRLDDEWHDDIHEQECIERDEAYD